jgi:hypothetical protein
MTLYMILLTRDVGKYPHHGEPQYCYMDYGTAYMTFQSALAWKDTPGFTPEYTWFLMSYEVAPNGEMVGTELARK